MFMGRAHRRRGVMISFSFVLLVGFRSFFRLWFSLKCDPIVKIINDFINVFVLKCDPYH